MPSQPDRQHTRSNPSKLLASALLLALLCCMGTESAAASKEKQLSLNSFIRLVAERNTVFEAILLDELPLQYSRTLDLPADDLILSIKGGYALALDAVDGAPEYSVALDKLFPATGTRVTASYQTDYSLSRRRNESEFSIAIVQPVAENAFGRAARLQDKLTGIENDLARYQIAEAYEDYLASLIRLYYDWYAASENLRTATTAWKDAEKQLENIRERERNAIALPIDVNKIKVQAVSRKETMIALKNEYRAFTNLVKEAVRDNDGPAPVPVKPESSAHMQSTGLESQLRLFRESSRTATMFALLEKKADTEVLDQADRLLPSINLTAGYNISGDDRYFTASEQGLFAGITMEWPLPDKQESARHEISRINRTRVSLSNSNTRLSLATALTNLYRSIENQQLLIGLAKDKIAISEAIVRDEKKNYSLGKAGLNDLIDEVNRLEEHRFNRISREIEKQKLIVEWKRLTDTLVREKDILKYAQD
ncbi:MAG: hypothetical protein C1941_03575 [Prosthecochloris sp.]|nr:hypothetical protein [Prosthecochloris sp.]